MRTTRYDPVPHIFTTQTCPDRNSVRSLGYPDFGSRQPVCLEYRLARDGGNLYKYYEELIDFVVASTDRAMPYVDLFNEVVFKNAWLCATNSPTVPGYSPPGSGQYSCDDASSGRVTFPWAYGKSANGGNFEEIAPTDRTFWQMYAGQKNATAYAEAWCHSAKYMKSKINTKIVYNDFGQLADVDSRIARVRAHLDLMTSSCVDAVGFQSHEGCGYVSTYGSWTQVGYAQIRNKIIGNWELISNHFSDKRLEIHLTEIDFTNCLANPYSFTMNSNGTFPLEHDYRGIGTTRWDQFYVYAHLLFSLCFRFEW